MVDSAPSVGILSSSKNLVDARDKNIQQRAKSLSLAGALLEIYFVVVLLYKQTAILAQLVTLKNIKIIIKLGVIRF